MCRGPELYSASGSYAVDELSRLDKNILSSTIYFEVLKVAIFSTNFLVCSVLPGKRIWNNTGLTNPAHIRHIHWHGPLTKQVVFARKCQH